MKKVIFGSVCMISGMLLALLVQQAGPGGAPGPGGGIHLVSLVGYAGALALVVAGLYLGCTGIKERDL